MSSSDLDSLSCFFKEDGILVISLMRSFVHPHCKAFAWGFAHRRETQFLLFFALVWSGARLNAILGDRITSLCKVVPVYRLFQFRLAAEATCEARWRSRTAELLFASVSISRCQPILATNFEIAWQKILPPQLTERGIRPWRRTMLPLFPFIPPSIRERHKSIWERRGGSELLYRIMWMVAWLINGGVQVLKKEQRVRALCAHKRWALPSSFQLIWLLFSKSGKRCGMEISDIKSASY